MEQAISEIAFPYTDSGINHSLGELSAEPGSYTRHFTQSEEFFIRLPEPFVVPSMPIHHDVGRAEPPPGYVGKLGELLSRIASHAPDVFSGLTYLFDPTEINRPIFFQVRSLKEMYYLYLLRVDFSYRPAAHEVVERGSNDVSPAYKSRDLILEPDIVPLSGLKRNGNSIHAFRIEQSVSQTWIGETGRGYFVQGIWLDRELTKFFTKLFLPQGKRIYPYFPFTCKYRAICHSLISLDPEARRRGVAVLHRARGVLQPYMSRIQEALRKSSFSEDLDTFQALRHHVPEELQNRWEDLRLKPYLDEEDNKEFVVE
jgi:hypothetical protein